MSASQETGRTIVYEMPRNPASLEELKATILKRIFKHFPDLQLKPEDVASTSTTFKEAGGQRIITSLVVTLRQEVPITSGDKKIYVSYLRWHYQEGVGVSDNELLQSLLRPHLTSSHDVTWVRAMPQADVVPSPTQALAPGKPTYSLVHELISLSGIDQPELQRYLLGFWQYLRTITGTKPVDDLQT